MDTSSKLIVAMATRLNLFQSVQSFYRVMGIYPIETNQKFRLLLKRLYFGVSTISTLSASVAFLLLEAQTVDQYASAFHGAISELCQVTHFLISAWQMSNVLRLIENFEGFIEKRSQANTTSKLLYIGISERIERMSKRFYFCAIKVSFACIAIVPLLGSYTNYFLNDLKEASFQLPYDGWYPFNWRTPFGYLIAFFSQCGASFVILYNLCPMICFLIGTCWVLNGCCVDISNELPHLNTIKKPRHNGCGELKARICSVAQLLGDFTHFVNEFNVVNKFHCLMDFAWSIMAVSCMLLACLVLLSDENTDAMEVVNPLFLMMWTYFLVYVYCECGQMVADQLSVFEEQLCQCKWHAWPIGIQQIFMVIVASAQQPAQICGYGNIECTRFVFQKIFRVSFSYFTTLRQFVR